MQPDILMIIGPTAIGKSDFALQKARDCNGVIISADAFQVYKGMDIGTAKVSASIRAEIPHYLIDIRTPNESYSVADFLSETDCLIESLREQQKPVILCGGTGFYLYAFLYKYDLNEKTRSPEARPDVRIIGLCAPREVVIERINIRVDHMIASGLVEEVRFLLESGVPETAQSMRAIGYKEVIQHLHGSLTHAEMVECIKIKTRQFSKRQMTWFKRFHHAEWIELS